MADLNWEPTKRQKIFFAATEDEVLYGGAAGGAKTEALIMLGFLRCSHAEGAHVLYLRNSFPDLEKSAIKRSLELFTGLGARYNASAHKWTIPHKQYNSILQFGYLEKDYDVFQYQSAEFDLILFDELTMFTEFQYTQMLARNRSSKQGIVCAVRSASNPGGPGHLWVKQRFVDPAPEGEAFTDPETGRTRKFIKSLVDDNPHIMDNDPGYKARLNELPEARRKQLRDGDWTVAEGMAFGEFSPDIHVIKTFDVPTWWTKWRGHDPGYTDPFSWHWFACDGDGNIYVYREYTRKPTDEKIVYSDQAKEVTRLSQHIDPVSGEPTPEEIEFTVCGRDAFSKHPESGKAYVDYYAEGGVIDCIQPPRDPEKTDRKFRKAVFHEYLKPIADENIKDEDGLPVLRAKLRIMDCCEELIRTLPVLEVDPRDAEKVRECGIDHWYDGVGMALQTWHTYKSAPPKEELSEVQTLKKKMAKRTIRRW